MFLLNTAGSFPSLSGRRWIVLLFARSPREVVFRISSQLSREFADRILLSHGLASVVLVLDDPAAVQLVRGACTEACTAIEVWPVESGTLLREGVQILDTSELTRPAPEPVSFDSLPYEAAAQVRQFNANLAMAWLRATRYAPAYESLLLFYHEVAAQASAGLQACNVQSGGTSAHRAELGREYFYRISGLVEMNAALSFLYSQALGSSPSVLDGAFPVAEYSLLGIGSVSLGVWRLYTHMSSVIGDASVPQKIMSSYASAAPFEPFVNRLYFNASDWDEHPAGVHNLPVPADDPTDRRYHTIYFSSRGGFHETLHTISVSWQCIHASALREWNLLTLSHEYLHAHVRDVLDAIIDLADEADLQALADAYAGRTAPATARRAMQLALVSAISEISTARGIAEEALHRDYVAEKIPLTITPDQIRKLHDYSWWYVNEIVVHVLDFLYFYNGQPGVYLSSLWNSWSLVPKVSHNLGHYVQRTICALASGTPCGKPEVAVFPEVCQQLEDEFRHIIDATGGAAVVVEQALEYLTSGEGRDRLKIEFTANLYVVRLTRAFFYDKTIHANLVRDTQSSVDDEGRIRYGLQPGDFEAFRIQSPVAFLRHRFETIAHRDAARDAEFASLWHSLLLIEEEMR